MMRILPVIIMMVSLAGCGTVIKSTRVTDSNAMLSGSNKVTGYYFLPRAEVKLLAEKKPNDKCNLEYKETLYVPDTDYLFRVDYFPAWYSADKVTIGLQNGFLKSIAVDTEDRSGAIAIKIAETAKLAAETALGGGFKRMGDSESFSFEFLVGPDTNATKVKDLNQRLQDLKCPQFEFSEASFSNPTNVPEREGIYTRATIPYSLFFSESGKTIWARTLTLPNGGPIVPVDVNRTALVKKTTTMQFENGALTEVKFDKPSTGEALVDIPLSIAKSVISIPAEIIQLKLNLNTESTKLIEAQKRELDARKDQIDSTGKLIKAEDDLRRLKEDLDKARAGSGAAN